MVDEHIRKTILELFRAKSILKDVGEDENFFEVGVSSLTVIELQISVEDALETTVPTSQLMRLPTIRGWVDAYTKGSNGAAVGVDAN